MTGRLAGYEDTRSLTIEITIEFGDPCVDTEIFTAPAELPAVQYEYSYQEGGISFTLERPEVYPPICTDIYYNCFMDPSSPLDLCITTAIDNTSFSFEILTGAYFFESDDPLSYPEGDYTFLFYAFYPQLPFGAPTFTSMIVTLSLTDPCPFAKLTID